MALEGIWSIKRNLPVGGLKPGLLSRNSLLPQAKYYSRHGGLRSKILIPLISPCSLVAQMVKSLSAVWEIWVRSQGQKDPLEKGMATHSSILAWRFPWTEKPGRLQSMGSQRAGQDWATNTFFHTWFPSLVWRVLLLCYAKSLQLCPTLCNPMDCSPPGSSVQRVLQGRILGWVAIPSSRRSFQPRDETCVWWLLH